MVFVKGYGMIEFVFGLVVDEYMFFFIGLMIKVMIVVVFGMFVDEGKVVWDDLVVQYLLNFCFVDDVLIW